MADLDSLPLQHEWKERLGLADRPLQEYYESAALVADEPHALAIRAILDQLGVSAVFCVQGVPTVAIVSLAHYDRQIVINLHGALWNQGLASLLLVISEDTLRAFSLAKTPLGGLQEEFDRRCLIATLQDTANVLEFRNLIYGAESGRLWREHAEYFNPKDRIDQFLLRNLNVAHRALVQEGLSSDAAQALLIQVMFIAYLEDREIIGPDYFRAATKDACENFVAVLATKNERALRFLFETLRADFNGDLFVAPCSFESQNKAPRLSAAHLDVLARFCSGNEEMAEAGGQYRFWGYDFRYIPIELVSAVYDRFLSEREDERREFGAYYTPMFLADTVVSQVWETLSGDTKEKGRFLDPACGSGVFLVRSFQRLCEHWRATRKSRTIRWDSLLTILQRVQGWDVNGSSVRVAVFSLYVALLEEVSPPDIRQLIKKGKLLPELWGKSLICADFFAVREAHSSFDVIVGNPPWTSRRGSSRSSVKWCEANSVPMPGGEDAWAFVWKALRHTSHGGVVAFLLPAMGFLHNHAANSVSARNELLQRCRVRRIVNFADLRFQLFEGAVRPAALFILDSVSSDGSSYRFDYWVPKADLNLQIKRLITLSSVDKFSLDSRRVSEEPLAFKQRLWMRGPDAKLLGYLSRFPAIGDLVKVYGSAMRRRENVTGQWVIGQGFQPFNPNREDAGSSYSMSKLVGKWRNLPIGEFRRLAQPTSNLTPWMSSRVRRKGFELGFSGARILVPRGVETSQTRLRASYVEAPLTFQHIIQAITVPAGQEAQAKLLTALLNSRIAVWFAFHATASFGSDRPEVQQAELMRLPFPSAKDMPDSHRAREAERKLISIVDRAIIKAKGSFRLEEEEEETLNEIDRNAYEFFCLSAEEIVLIEDGVECIIPATQPHEGSYPHIWSAPTEKDRREYAKVLSSSMAPWFIGQSISASLEAKSADIGVLRISLTDSASGRDYREASGDMIGETLSRISKHLPQRLPGNFQVIPDLRVFIENDLYLIKPMQRRFWLRSAALADAEAIATDLQSAIDSKRLRNHG